MLVNNVNAPISNTFSAPSQFGEGNIELSGLLTGTLTPQFSLLITAGAGSFDIDGYAGDFAIAIPGNARGFPLNYNSVFQSVAVPGPMVGAGLPGLALAFGGLMLWWRRRQHVSSVPV